MTPLGRLVVVTLMGVASVAVHPAEDPYELAQRKVRVFTDRDGLPQNSIERMTIGPLGRLWVTTREGLAIYDGTRWSTMPLPERSLSNWPRAIATDHEGSVWVGAERGGIYRHADGKWSRYATAEGLPSDRVRFVAEVEFDGASSLLVGTTGGPAILDREANRFYPIPDLHGFEVTSAAAFDDALWLGASPGGLFRYADGSWSNETPPSFDELSVTALLSSSEGLIAGTSRGLYAVSERGWERRGLEQFGDAAVHSLLEITDDGARSLWVGTAGHGIWISDDSGWKSIDVSDGLSNNFVFSLLAWPANESPRHVYAGTLSGIAEIGIGSWRTVDPADLPDRSVVSFLESGSELSPSYWIGTTHGLARLEGGEWRVVLPSASVFALMETADGRILAGTENGLLELHGQTWLPVEGGLPKGSVVALAEEHEGDETRLWAGMYGEGLWVWGDGRFRKAAALSDDRIEAILPVRLGDRNVVLIGTNRGLVLLDGGDLQVFTAEHGLPNETVRSLHVHERAGRRQLWVGTGGGVAWTSLEEPFEWHSLTDESAPRLPGNTVYRVEEDSQGRLYLFTSRGVLRIELNEALEPVSSTIFTTEQGLPSNEINFGATMRDSRGRIWAGTPLGAAIFDPAVENPDPPAILTVRGVEIDHHPVPPSDLYRMRADQHSFSMELLLVDLSGGESAQYRAWLAADGPDSHPWSSNSRIELESLAPGDYELQAEAIDDGGRHYGPVTLMIEVAAPVWMRWWAITLYLILVMFIIAGAVYWRMRALRHRARTLEEIVRSRTRDLEKSNRDLANANRALAAMSETDPLTGARNRRWVTLYLQAEADHVARSTRRSDELLLILVDIDHFKSVNDSFGHAIGDEVLRRFHDVLARSVRDTDTIVRWGGEEFLIIARRASRTEGTLILSRIMEEVRSEPFDAGEDRIVHLTCSAGLAPFPFEPADPSRLTWEEVLDIADHALYAVKQSGRDGWVAIFEGESPTPSDLLSQLRSDSSSLLDRHKIQVDSSFGSSRLSWPA